MKRILFLLLLLSYLTCAVYADDLSGELLDEDALRRGLTGEESELIGNYDFSAPPELSDSLRGILAGALKRLEEPLRQTLRSGCAVLAIALLSGAAGVQQRAERSAQICAVTAIAVLCLRGVDNLLRLGTDAIQELTIYAELFFPVSAGLMASAGRIGSASALSSAAVVLSDVLLSSITKLLPPMICLYLAASYADSLSESSALRSLRGMLSWSVRFLLKAILYGFTGFLSVSQVISGAADAAATKAAKLTISGMIPVVGSIISDASETILLSASVLRGSVGLFGVLCTFAICIVPFLRVMLYYLMMKLVCAFSGVLALQGVTKWLQAISDAAGLILAALGTSGLLMLVSVVCSLKAVGAG